MRTMIDALEPGIDALRSFDLPKAVEAANQGMEATKQLISSAGRSNYINNDVINGVPDPGAVAISIAFTSTYEALK